MVSKCDPLFDGSPKAFTDDLIMLLCSDQRLVKFVRETSEKAGANHDAISNALMMTSLEGLLESADKCHPLVRVIVGRVLLNIVDWSKVAEAVLNDRPSNEGIGSIHSLNPEGN